MTPDEVYYGPYGYGTPPPWHDRDYHVTTGNATSTYPCDMGTGRPVGYHKFASSDNGVVVCEYCGKRPKN